jgi:hypothetical protein
VVVVHLPPSSFSWPFVVVVVVVVSFSQRFGRRPSFPLVVVVVVVVFLHYIV